MSVTIKQIAALANVSIGTVDRVLHNRPGVRPEKREEIERIAGELGYQPNIPAKALAFRKKPVTIGVIVYEHYHPYAETIIKGIKAAEKELKDFGVKVEILSMNEHLATEQIKILDLLIKQGVSGIIIRPIDDPIICDKINEATNAGIPVITYNSDIDNSNRLCFIGQNLYKSGEVAAELLGKIMNKTGKVAILTGFLKVKAHNERIKGFVDVMSTYYPNIQIIDTIETLEDATTTYNKVIRLLETNKDLKGLYATAGCFEQMGQAIKNMGKEHQISFSGYDLYPEVIQLVNEGIMDFSIAQDLFSQGYEPIKIIFDLIFKNKRPKEEFIYTKIDIRVRWNIK
ncbi:MAG: LacI family transcriptional regulator [Firmicutes bacterium HGW-Firmicutes-7]|nr:MAG: LacI family transcriptional regulator [Firmicutes bacterium HGW-Firmicutes-7]